MLKDIFHKETFAFFIDRFASEDLILRSRSPLGPGRLFLFDLSGFVLFYVFLVVAKTVYRSGTLDAADLAAPALLYVFLLYVGGALFFVLRLFNVGKNRIFNLYDKIVFVLLIALAIFAADHFLSNSIFKFVESTTCSILERRCFPWQNVHKSLISAFYVTAAVAILAINTAKKHWHALHARPNLVRPVVLNCIITGLIAEIFGTIVLKALVLTVKLI